MSRWVGSRPAEARAGQEEGGVVALAWVRNCLFEDLAREGRAGLAPSSREGCCRVSSRRSPCCSAVSSGEVQVLLYRLSLNHRRLIAWYAHQLGFIDSGRHNRPLGGVDVLHGRTRRLLGLDGSVGGILEQGPPCLVPGNSRSVHAYLECVGGNWRISNDQQCVHAKEEVGCRRLAKQR